jgi:hypothetical protein
MASLQAGSSIGVKFSAGQLGRGCTPTMTLLYGARQDRMIGRTLIHRSADSTCPIATAAVKKSQANSQVSIYIFHINLLTLYSNDELQVSHM